MQRQAGELVVGDLGLGLGHGRQLEPEHLAEMFHEEDLNKQVPLGDVGVVGEVHPRVLERFDAAVPHQTMLVLDATTGHNGLEQARVFQEAVGVSGVFLAKLDGTAKGGITVAIAQELQLPVVFIGTGEGLDDLSIFDTDDFVDALFGDEPAAG